MKKVFIPILFLATLTIGVGYAMIVQKPQQQTTPTSLLNNQPNKLLTAQNPNYILHLKSNPTTGYSWFIVNYDHQLLQMVSHQYHQHQTNPKMVGASGCEVFTFQATQQALTAPHTTTIEMVYARPWMMKNGQIPADATVKTFTVNIK